MTSERTIFTSNSKKIQGNLQIFFRVGGTRSRACTPFFQRSGLPQIIYQSCLKEEVTVVRDFVGSSYTLTGDFFTKHNKFVHKFVLT